MVVHPLESARRAHSPRGALPSIAVHAAIVLVAVHATAHAAVSHDPPTIPPIVTYVHPTVSKPVEPQGAERNAQTDRSRTSTPIDQFHIDPKPISWPTMIADRISRIDSSHQLAAVDASDFGNGVTGAPLAGAGGTVTSGSAPFTMSQVERSVAPLGDAPTPVYPEALRSTGIRGSVTAEFVVDTTGRVEPASFRALSSDNDLFSAAVRAAVLRTRFRPAEAGGRRVRQLVQESFSFVLD